MIEYQAIFQQAFKGETVHIFCGPPPAANNLRQKFYRYRISIKNSEDELALLVDDLVFTLGKQELIISFNNPQNILEAIHDQDTGAEALNPAQQPDIREEQRPQRKDIR